MTQTQAASKAIAFYDSNVFHARLRPHEHRFFYKVLSVVIDIDRLAEAHAASPLFSVGSRNLLSFWPKDHGPRDGSDLRAYVDTLLREQDCERPARVLLLCMPRIAGLGFNPLSVYYCLDAKGGVAQIVYEVRNTFGERHSYVMRLSSDAKRRPSPHEADKIFYVSPFMDMALRYRFLTQAPDDDLSVKIVERDAGGVVLTALLSGKAFAPTVPALLRRAFSSPLFGFKVVAGIHWEALRLWLKGHGLRPRPTPPALHSFDEAGPYTHATGRTASPRGS